MLKMLQTTCLLCLLVNYSPKILLSDGFDENILHTLVKIWLSYSPQNRIIKKQTFEFFLDESNIFQTLCNYMVSFYSTNFELILFF